MELINIQHHPEQEPAFEPDLFIAASGYESRSTCVPEELNNPGRKKVVLAFTTHLKEPARIENDRYFSKHGYESFLTKPFGVPDFPAIFREIDQEHISILIDLSLMSPKWYDEFLYYLHNNEKYKKVVVRISYCPALLFEPLTIRRKVTLHNFTLKGNQGISRKNRKKTALIMGLGNDKRIGQSVYNLVKPDHMLLLYADPDVHKSYVENIFVNNHSVINHVDIKYLIQYSLRDTEQLYKTLIDLILPLREEYNVVIVPQGPKIFSLLTMLFHLNYPDVTISYPEYSVKGIRDKKSFADHISLDLEFAADY